jgi:hypothetical protein
LAFHPAASGVESVYSSPIIPGGFMSFGQKQRSCGVTDLIRNGDYRSPFNGPRDAHSLIDT